MRDTRRALLDTARRIFTRDGFQATRTEEIVEESGLTRGALYHHFRDKEDLFRAVHEEVLAEVAPLLWRRSADPTASAWTLFRANSEIYLEAASTNEAYRQIVLVDGPAVLGWRLPLRSPERSDPHDRGVPARRRRGGRARAAADRSAGPSAGRAGCRLGHVRGPRRGSPGGPATGHPVLRAVPLRARDHGRPHRPDNHRAPNRPARRRRRY